MSTLFIARLIALVIEAYGLAGLVFAIVYLPKAVLRLDDRLRGSPIGVRFLILPGVAALWPLFAWWWVTGRTAPVEQNSHRRLAQERSS